MSAPTPWQSGTAHSVGDVVQAFTDPGTGFFFRCTVAGTTGSSEPFWPSFIGNEAVDGTVTWKAVSIISGDFQAPDPSAIIELFELQLFANIHGVNDIYRFHAGTNLVRSEERRRATHTCASLLKQMALSIPGKVHYHVPRFASVMF